MASESDLSDTFPAQKDGSAVMPLQSVDLCDSITDTGKFAYTCLCAVSLNHLFDADGIFKAKVIDSLIKHLKQPEQVKSSICAIADGHGSGGSDPFVEALLKEAVVDSSSRIVVEDFIKLVLKSGYYDARMRVLAKHLTFLLRVTVDCLEECEERILHDLKEAEHQQTEEEIDEEKKAKRNKKAKRYFMIGLATVGGGALIGLTGGLAAPFVAAGAGAVIGGAGAAALGTATGIYVIGSLFGVAGAGLTGYKMKKRVGAIEQFEFMPIAESSQLHVTIAIAGWLTKDEGDFAIPWRSLAHSKEQYCLKWESSHLLAMGQAMDKIVDSIASVAAQEALKYTVLSGILVAIAWPASLMALSGIIDNPWSVCLRRSQQVGYELANVLLSRQQGRRPVTLIGFSLGARVIYYCLEEMAKRKGCEGIVEDVYMFGTPVSADASNWEKFGHVVAGTITNGYCRGDWLLKFLYRTSSAQMKIAGLHPVKWDDRRMCNIDLSDVVVGHTDYANKMDDILNIIGIPTKEAPKRITQLRLHPSWSKDAIRSPSNLSLSSSHSSGSPSREVVKEVNVAKEECRLKRLTKECGEEDAEFGMDAWDLVLRSEADKSSSAVESMRLLDEERSSRARKGNESKEWMSDDVATEELATDNGSDTESSSYVISASVSRDSCLEDSELSLATDASLATDDLSVATDDNGSVATIDEDVTMATDAAEKLSMSGETNLATDSEDNDSESRGVAMATGDTDGNVSMTTNKAGPQLNWDSTDFTNESDKPKIEWDPIT